MPRGIRSKVISGGRTAFPGIVVGGGGGGGAGAAASALISSTIAALGSGPFVDGQVAVIRVGAWPNTEYVELFRDGTAGKWVSKPRTGLSQSDINYMGVNTVGLNYIGTNTSGTTTGAIGWSSRYIRRAQELFAAGLSLQARVAIIMAGQAANAFTVRVRFFQHNDGDAVVFSADGSTAIAELPAIVSPATSTVTFKAQTWQDVLKISTVNPLAAADVTKANLWARLYGSIPAGGYGQEIDCDLEYRWVA